MKDFDDFRKSLTVDVAEQLQIQTLKKVEKARIQHLKDLNSNSFSDEIEELVWSVRAFNSNYTIEMLNLYHKWLHESED